MTKKKTDYIIVAGCGRMGMSIASMLSSQGEKVAVVDISELSFKKLSNNYKGLFIEGDATDIDVLERVGIDRADMVVAATNDDNANIMISEIASAIFHVPKVISRLYDTDKQSVYHEFNINTIYPAKLSLKEFENVLSQSDPEVYR